MVLHVHLYPGGKSCRHFSVLFTPSVCLDAYGHRAVVYVAWHAEVIRVPGSPPTVPSFVMYIAGPIELLGGLLVAVGLYSGWAAFFCSGEMAAAYWMALELMLCLFSPSGRDGFSRLHGGCGGRGSHGQPRWAVAGGGLRHRRHQSSGRWPDH